MNLAVSTELRQHLDEGRLLFPVAQVRNLGRPTVEVPVADGSVTADRTRDTRYACDLRIPLVEGLATLLSPYRTTIRVLMEARYEGGRADRIPVCTVRVQDVEPSRSGQELHVSCLGFEAWVKDDKFYVPGYLPAGSALQGLQRFVRESIPAYLGVNFDLRVPDVLVGEASWGTDRWGSESAACQMIARSLAAEVYFDVYGQCIVRPTPGIGDVMRTVVRGGAGGTLVGEGVSRSYSRDGVFNLVVATSSRTDGTDTTGLFALAWDDDPASPTYLGSDPYASPAGTFGRAVLPYSTPLPQDFAGCMAAARSVLADKRGLVTKTSASVLPDPTREPGDVELVQTERGLERHILDAWSLPLSPGAMSTTYRTTAIVTE